MWKDMELFKNIVSEIVQKDNLLVVSNRGVIYDTIEAIGNFTGVHYKRVLDTYLDPDGYAVDDSIFVKLATSLSYFEKAFELWKQELKDNGYLIVDSIHEAKKSWYRLKDTSSLDQLRIRMITEYLDDHEMAVYYDKNQKGYIADIEIDEIPF